MFLGDLEGGRMQLDGSVREREKVFVFRPEERDSQTEGSLGLLRNSAQGRSGLHSS